MSTTVKAVYQNGVLVLAAPLQLRDNTHVKVTIETDAEREAWLKASEESLNKVWDNDADDIFNELRDR